MGAFVEDAAPDTEVVAPIAVLQIERVAWGAYMLTPLSALS